MSLVKLHSGHLFAEENMLRFYFSLQEGAPQQGEAVGRPQEELLLQVRPPRRRGGQ